MLVAVAGIARATALDLLRRPTTITSTLAAAATLAAVARLGNPAAGVRDNAALATELVGTTLFLVTVMTAALLGVRSVQAEHADGLAAEIRTAPVGVGALLTGRVLGITAGVSIAALVAGGLVLATAAAQLGPSLAERTTLASTVLVALPLSAWCGSCLGTLFGTLAPSGLASVGVAATLLALRWLGGTAERTVWFPDPSRLDVSRSLAFGPAPEFASLVASWAGTSLQCAALLLLTVWSLRRRTV